MAAMAAATATAAAAPVMLAMMAALITPVVLDRPGTTALTTWLITQMRGLGKVRRGRAQ